MMELVERKQKGRRQRMERQSVCLCGQTAKVILKEDSCFLHLCTVLYNSLFLDAMPWGDLEICLNWIDVQPIRAVNCVTFHAPLSVIVSNPLSIRNQVVIDSSQDAGRSVKTGGTLDETWRLGGTWEKPDYDGSTKEAKKVELSGQMCLL